MHGKKPLGLAMTILMTLACATAHGDDPAAPMPDDWSELAQRLQKLEEDNSALKSEVDQLRAANEEGWLTEQRAKEIRTLVSDVLADADQRASLQGSGMNAGWSPDDGFFLASSDGKFKLNIGGVMQVRFAYSYRDEPPDSNRSGFELPHSKLTFRGHVFDPSIEYLIRGQFSRIGGGQADAATEEQGGEFKLLDFWVRFRLDNEWSIRFGQFKVPFNREELVAEEYQQLVERSLVNESLNLGRSQGIELAYRDPSWHALIMYNEGMDDTLGQAGSLVRTGPPNTGALNRDTEYAGTVRLERLFAGNWDQFKQFTSPTGDPFGLMAGLAAHYQESEWVGQESPQRVEIRYFSATGDISVQWGGANLYASMIYGYLDNEDFGNFDFYGAVLQGGVYVTPKWELVGRFEWGRATGGTPVLSFPNLYLITLGCNYYLDGQDMRWATDFGVSWDTLSPIWQSDLADWRLHTNFEVVFRTQFQLLF